MRALILLTMCTATLAHAAWNGYVETRETSLDAEGIDSLDVEAGAGSLSVRGDPGIEEIRVSATIRVPGADEAEGRKVIEEDMVLDMDRTGSTAVLESYFESSLFDRGEAPRIDLEITLPARLGLAVDDGSGPVDIVGIGGPLDIDDGSGSLAVTDAGADVAIDDGSGSIRVSVAAGEVTVVDGSGSIDPEGETLTYSWSDIDGVVLGTTEVVNLPAALPGDNTYFLTVTDPQGDTSTDSVVVGWARPCRRC